MFTGIVEELGTVKKLQTEGKTMVLSIQGNKVPEDLNLGDSVAVNGVCLTVTALNNSIFELDVMPETFQSTSLRNLKQGSPVNLERAVQANGRFGGHFVTGHVDTVGQIMKRERRENAIYIDVSVPKEFSHLTLFKGSIALDGTSLTIFGLTDDKVTVSIIPHTAKESVLGTKKIGDIVNVEFDMIGKYLYSFLGKEEDQNEVSEGISKTFLKENGFL